MTYDEIEKLYGKEAVEFGYHVDKGFLCYNCAESDLGEPPLTVFHNRDKEPKRIGHYISDYWLEGEEAPFSFEWVPTDPWRGHYETKHDDGLVKIFEDAILAYHESEEMLKALHDISLKAFDQAEIDYYRVFSRTSNVFCTNLDFYIDKKKEELGREIIDAAKKYVNYDDPVFSTGILFPRGERADFELSNVNELMKSELPDEIKKLILEIGPGILEN